MNYKPGYICPITGRVAVRASDFAHSDMNGEVPAYLLNEEARSMGLEPWRQIDGIDIYRDGGKLDLWLDNGRSMTVDTSALIFLETANAERLNKLIATN